MKDARSSESERQKYKKLVSINLPEKDAIVDVDVMPVVVADVGVDAAVHVDVSAKRLFF